MVDDLLPTVRSLLVEAFPPSATSTWRIERVADVGRGRGVFSVVLQVELTWTAGSGPASVAVKLPASGPNGDAARAAGAYDREALAYRDLLPRSPVPAPRCHLVRQDGDRASFVLEDLTAHRSVDQLDGLDVGDATRVAMALAALHRHWEGSPALDELDLRRATPTAFDQSVLEAGVAALRARWESASTPVVRRAFERLVGDRERLVAAFASTGPPTLCHGDPRADNLAFDDVGQPVLYDWQQIAIQLGPADLAWLTATSLDPASRRAHERSLVDAYGTTMDRYRLGLLLPGLAVLFLAQREATDERTERLIATSIDRIGTAIADLDVPSAV